MKTCFLVRPPPEVLSAPDESAASRKGMRPHLSMRIQPAPLNWPLSNRTVRDAVVFAWRKEIPPWPNPLSTMLNVCRQITSILLADDLQVSQCNQ